MKLADIGTISGERRGCVVRWARSAEIPNQGNATIGLEPRVVELAVLGAVEEAFPLKIAEHADPAAWVGAKAHQ